MKTITMVKDNSPKGYAFILSKDISTDEYKKFKSEFSDTIELIKIKGLDKSVIFDFTEIGKIKFFMSGSINISEWNARREEAKAIFSMQTINELDASGYVSKCLR
jgi:hypothetical protein